MKKAFEIVVRLYEKDDDEWTECDTVNKIITIADSISKAADFVLGAVTEADETEEDFEWRAIAASQLDGTIALPAITKRILPTIKC